MRQKTAHLLNSPQFGSENLLQLTTVNMTICNYKPVCQSNWKINNQLNNFCNVSVLHSPRQCNKRSAKRYYPEKLKNCGTIIQDFLDFVIVLAPDRNEPLLSASVILPSDSAKSTVEYSMGIFSPVTYKSTQIYIY